MKICGNSAFWGESISPFPRKCLVIICQEEDAGPGEICLVYNCYKSLVKQTFSSAVDSEGLTKSGSLAQ